MKKPFYEDQFLLTDNFDPERIDAVKSRRKQQLYSRVIKSINPRKNYRIFETDWITEQTEQKHLITLTKIVFVALISFRSVHQKLLEVGDYAWAEPEELKNLKFSNSISFFLEPVIEPIPVSDFNFMERKPMTMGPMKTCTAVMEEYEVEGESYYFWKVTDIS